LELKVSRSNVLRDVALAPAIMYASSLAMAKVSAAVVADVQDQVLHTLGLELVDPVGRALSRPWPR